MRRILLALMPLLLAVPACGDDAVTTTTPSSTAAGTTTSPGPTTTTTSTGSALPPHTLEGLGPILDPMVEPLGFRVTRAALISLDTYQATPDGTHLAVYVVPLDDQTPSGYARQIVPLAAALLPGVFDRWPALQSFDVCQEPFDWDGEGTPPSYTILDLDRESAAALDWATVELPELIALAKLDRDITLSVDATVGRSRAFQDALAEGA
jgi:hypothetical protein